MTRWRPKQDRILEAGRRTVAFCDKQLVGVPIVARPIAALRTAVARLEKTNLDQLSAKGRVKDGAQRRDRLRKTLRTEQMIPVVRRCKLLFRDEPAVRKTLRVPHATVTFETLAKSAAEMATALEPYRSLLVEEGFDADFVERLASNAAALKTLCDAIPPTRDHLSNVTREINRQCAEIRDLVRAIDGHVRVILARKSGVIDRVGERASRVGKRVGRPRASTVARRNAKAAASED